MIFLEKLQKLRDMMSSEKVDAILIGTTDPHQSPSVAPHWKMVQWFTDFSGSLGTCVVTIDAIAFWTDGRYTLQAQRELYGKDIEIYTTSNLGSYNIAEWIINHIPADGSLALDGEVFSYAAHGEFRHKLSSVGVTIVDICYISNIWQDRPAIFGNQLFELGLQYAGASRREKIMSVRYRMKEANVECYLTSCLDSIAWLMNLRGNDNPLYPVFHSYVFITEEKVYLCVDLSKINNNIANSLAGDEIILCNIEDIYDIARIQTANKTVCVDPHKISLRLYNSMNAALNIVEMMDIITKIKSKKNNIEQQNIRISNIKECIAICRLIKYIKESIGRFPLNEYSIGQKIDEFRKIDPLFMQPGNLPIVAVGENAALPHYKPNITNHSDVKADGFLLFDLCAHYYTGSTDITRTIQIGYLSDEMRRDYTITLKSHIALASLLFPFGLTGNVLDGIVKSYHWRERMTYCTGTGHGIGCSLYIHEGPCKIIMEYSPFFPYGMNEPLDTGMLFSNEPGVYKKGRYGIRLENDVIVQEDCVNEFGRFLKFETVTFCPFEREAIMVEMLTVKERLWLNDYHRITYEKLSPFMSSEETKWLKEATRTL